MPLSVGWPYHPVGQFTTGWSLASRLTMGAVGLTSKFFIDFLNKTTVHNIDQLHDCIENRPIDQPLITACNHHSCLDEPLIWALLKWKHHSYRNDLMRWTTGASDVCFKKEWHSKFFALGRTIPLVRGDGVYQKSMDFAVQLLNQGAWVHIYPEGKVNVTHRQMRLKWGIGRLIADCRKIPIVIPFWHLGMDDILPNVRPYRLKLFKKLSILIGQPLDLSDIINQLNCSNASPLEKRKILTDIVQSEFRKLEVQAKSLHYNNRQENETETSNSISRSKTKYDHKMTDNEIDDVVKSFENVHNYKYDGKGCVGGGGNDCSNCINNNNNNSNDNIDTDDVKVHKSEFFTTNLNNDNDSLPKIDEEVKKRKKMM